jgi:hypothetical protein
MDLEIIVGTEIIAGTVLITMVLVTITSTVVTAHILMGEVLVVALTVHTIATIIMHIVHLHTGEEMDLHQIIFKMQILQMLPMHIMVQEEEVV